MSVLADAVARKGVVEIWPLPGSHLGSRRRGHFVVDGDVVDESAEGVDEERSRLPFGGILANIETGGAVGNVGTAHAAGANLLAVQVERGGILGLVEYGRERCPLAEGQLLFAGNRHEEARGRAEAQAHIALRRELEGQSLLSAFIEITADGGIGGCGLGILDAHHRISLGSQGDAQRERGGAEGADGHAGHDVVAIAVEAKGVAVKASGGAGRQLRDDVVRLLADALGDGTVGVERHVEMGDGCLCAGVGSKSEHQGGCSE